MEEKTSISISKGTHLRIRDYCDENALKVGSWIDNVLRERLDKLNK